LDNVLRSGDGGHIEADGYVFVTGRIKDMIISGGENIDPAEIERVLVEHPAVLDAAVISVPHERWGELPKAVAVAKPGATIGADQLLAYCREHLPHYLDPADPNPTCKLAHKSARERAGAPAVV